MDADGSGRDVLEYRVAGLDDAGGHDDDPDDGFEVGMFDELLHLLDEAVHGVRPFNHDEI